MTANVNGGGRLLNGLRIACWGLAAALLATPLVAMQFTDEVVWTAFDFAVFAAMLAAAGGAMELAVRMSGDWSYRAAAAVAVLAGFLLIWSTLAVGIIGDEDEPANLMFFGVLLIGAVGAAIARFRAEGMGRTLLAMAFAQAAAGATALIAGWGATANIWPMDIIGASGVFTVAWLLAAGLFRKAAADQRAGADLTRPA